MGWKPEFSVRLLTTISQEEACCRLRTSLQEQDLDVIEQIDLSAMLENGTGLSIGKYTILTVLCPLSTYHALLAIPEAGAFIPFHIVVCSKQGKTLVSYASPEWLAVAIDRIEFRLMAKDLSTKLESAVSVLKLAETTCRGTEMRSARQ